MLVTKILSGLSPWLHNLKINEAPKITDVINIGVENIPNLIFIDFLAISYWVSQVACGYHVLFHRKTVCVCVLSFVYIYIVVCKTWPACFRPAFVKTKYVHYFWFVKFVSKHLHSCLRPIIRCFTMISNKHQQNRSYWRFSNHWHRGHFTGSRVNRGRKSGEHSCLCISPLFRYNYKIQVNELEVKRK